MRYDADYDKQLEEAEWNLGFAEESNQTPPPDIVAFNELRSCFDLFNLHSEGELEIQPEYQRDIVWENSDQTRFIDSLAKQLPIPSMCLSFDYKTEKRQVVDGLQRMYSIIKFLGDRKWRFSRLDDINKAISGNTVEQLKSVDPRMYSRIKRTTLPITVLRCDLSRRHHQEYIFTIFHRLNKGGSKLTNQEIRNCIYSGNFNNLLREIVKEKIFRDLFSIDDKKQYRFSNEELILRIFSYTDGYSTYKAPLSKFLNAFMSRRRLVLDDELSRYKLKFLDAAEILYTRILRNEPLGRLSKATAEAIFVGIIRNYSVIETMKDDDLRSRYFRLRNDRLFSPEELKEGLADTDRVRARLDRAIEIFSA